MINKEKLGVENPVENVKNSFRAGVWGVTVRLWFLLRNNIFSKKPRFRREPSETGQALELGDAI